jgi:tetratricopeptide (TPR) repeat protein
LEKALGPDHADVGRAQLNVASILYVQGRYAEAEREYAAALAVYEKALGPAHPDLAAVHNNLGAVYQAQDRYAEAARAYEKGLALAEAGAGPESRRVVTALEGIADAQLRLRRPAEAAEAAERLLAIRTKSGAALEIAAARFLLARALWESNADRSRARTLAEQARDAYRDAGDAHAETLADIERWLARR